MSVEVIYPPRQPPKTPRPGGSGGFDNSDFNSEPDDSYRRPEFKNNNVPDLLSNAYAARKLMEARKEYGFVDGYCAQVVTSSSSLTREWWEFNRRHSPNYALNDEQRTQIKARQKLLRNIGLAGNDGPEMFSLLQFKDGDCALSKRVSRDLFFVRTRSTDGERSILRERFVRAKDNDHLKYILSG